VEHAHSYSSTYMTHYMSNPISHSICRHIPKYFIRPDLQVSSRSLTQDPKRPYLLRYYAEICAEPLQNNAVTKCDAPKSDVVFQAHETLLNILPRSWSIAMRPHSYPPNEKGPMMPSPNGGYTRAAVDKWHRMPEMSLAGTLIS
jgi:hypothetical protein